MEVKPHRATQNGHNFKVMACLLLESFCLMFSDHGGPRVTETTEMEIAGNGHSSIVTLCSYINQLMGSAERLGKKYSHTKPNRRNCTCALNILYRNPHTSMKEEYLSQSLPGTG